MDRPAAVGNDRGFPLSLPLLRLYIEELEKNPVRTKAITSGIIAAVSDVTSQVLLYFSRPGSHHFSWRSTVAFAAFSTACTGPVTHYLYKYLEHYVSKKSQFSTLKKVVLDRLLFAPPYLLALFYFVALMEGKSPREAWQRVKLVYWSALLKNFVIWGVAQFINMKYIPLKYRVLYGNLVSLLWNVYLALVQK